MRRLLIIFSLSLVLTAHSFAQTPELFSGKWILDKSAPANSEAAHYSYYHLSLSFDGDKLTVTKDFEFDRRKTSYSLILFTNKRGEKNSVPNPLSEEAEVSSKTRWKNGSIIREYSRQQDMGSIQSMNMYRVETTIEKYSLSEDTKNLYLTTTVTSEMYTNGMSSKTMGNLNSVVKLVFRRE